MQCTLLAKDCTTFDGSNVMLAGLPELNHSIGDNVVAAVLPFCTALSSWPLLSFWAEVHNHCCSDP